MTISMVAWNLFGSCNDVVTGKSGADFIDYLASVESTKTDQFVSTCGNLWINGQNITWSENVSISLNNNLERKNAIMVKKAVATTANRLEETGDNLSNVFVETLSGHPGTGVKSLGFAFWSVGKGVYDIAKESVSGVFGVVYEVADELVYIILPSASNNSSLNPNEELVILF